MPKPLVVGVFCIISAALGAAVGNYLAGGIEHGGSHLGQAVAPKPANAAPGDTNVDMLGDVEVLGDRVRCDVRYTELKIPPEAYQSFKRKCMGKNFSDDD
jgi:hypothetical protein